MNRITQPSRIVKCLACDQGGEWGPLRKLVVYHHAGTCGAVVADAFKGLKAYLEDAHKPEVKAETGIAVASGYMPKEAE